MKHSSIKYFFVIDFPKITLVGFLFSILIAMKLYPSGTIINNDTVGYLFFENFLSDLGRTISHGKDNNFHASLLFNMALTFAGITYIIFYYLLNTLFNSAVSRLGSIFGILGACCLIGVAFTPADLYLDPHILFNMWVFRFFLLSTVFYSWIMYKSDKINNFFMVGNLIFIISLFLYILVLMYGPSPYESHNALVFQAVTQKFILINFFFSIGLQTAGYKNLFN